jgi:acetoin utilization deacetylase AcuC-like enzyme
MRFGYDARCLDHDTGTHHPETAERLEAIRRRLSREHHVEFRPARLASVDTLCDAHDAAYVEEVREFCRAGGGSWDPDTVAVEATWEAARASAGLAVEACEAALDGADGTDTPFALGRPPGHHALAGDAMGFCFFNNAIVAAEAALRRPAVQRVAIFDWDVHHGNGCEDMAAGREAIHYSSIHQQGLYPGSGQLGATDDGTLLNLPLPDGAGDAGYLDAVDRALVPALERFDPDLLIVAAGFDAHELDPISTMQLSTEGYGLLADRLRGVASRTNAAHAYVLEGGYGVDALAGSVAMINELYGGREPAEPTGEPSPAVSDVVDRVVDRQGL